MKTKVTLKIADRKGTAAEGEAFGAGLTQWLESFRKRHGRAPRVLHIGNIANNAYNNAKVLNMSGLDCDVICYDYYHSMGCPEWDDADFEGEINDHFCPDWSSLDLKGFKRPEWFVQGPVELCIKYLISKRKGELIKRKKYWRLLGYANKTFKKNRRFNNVLNDLAYVFLKALSRLEGFVKKRDILATLCNKLQFLNRKVFLFGDLAAVFVFTAALPVILLFRCGLLLRNWSLLRNRNSSGYVFGERVKELENIFPLIFANRIDKLKPEDLEHYRYILPFWNELFEHYDLIQAYATDPVLPMLSSNRPFIGFEHGTLRDFTMRDDPVCRNTALAYHLADHVFITNGDCLEYAQRIGVKDMSPMPHNIREDVIQRVDGRYEELHREFSCKYIFLCTLRHDWKVKGTDIYIRSLPKIINTIGGSFKLLMTKWGSQLSDSKALASELGVSDYIEWIEPVGLHKLSELMKSVDVLFDQIALPHFGATAPKGIAAGVPVIMSYNPESTAWIIPELAPILSAWNTEDVVKNVRQALDPDWIEDYKARAQKWISSYHSAKQVIDIHIKAYREVINKSEAKGKEYEQRSV